MWRLQLACSCTDVPGGPRARARRHRWALPLALSVVAACVASAQAASAPGAGTMATGQAACLDAIPASAMRAVPVFLRLAPPATADAAMRDQLALLAQELARGVRLRTGGSDEGVALPSATPGWRTFDDHGLALLVTPDSVRVLRDTLYDPAARTLIAAAIDSVVGEGGVFFWPERSPRATLRVPIELSVPPFDSTGRTSDGAEGAGAGFPVYAIRHPWWTPPMAAADGVRVTYPESARRLGADGGVWMRFVVGADGRSVAGSVRDEPPADLARYTRERREAYDALVGAVRQAIERGRFVPRRYAGCPTDREVRQFFQFELVR